MELFDLSPDQLNMLSILIAKEYSTKYNELQLSILSNFFSILSGNIDSYVTSFEYFEYLNNSEK